jgi:hypothetical protein
MFCSAELSLVAVKMRKSYLVTGSFWYDFTESQAASFKHFQGQNHHFGVFEAGYWKDFQIE